jgi:hypothetical protein
MEIITYFCQCFCKNMGTLEGAAVPKTLYFAVVHSFKRKRERERERERGREKEVGRQ